MDSGEGEEAEEEGRGEEQAAGGGDERRGWRWAAVQLGGRWRRPLRDRRLGWVRCCINETSVPSVEREDEERQRASLIKSSQELLRRIKCQKCKGE